MGPARAQQRLRVSRRERSTQFAPALPAGVPSPQVRWLSRLWPLAVLFHLAGNSDHLGAFAAGTVTAIAIAQLAVAALAIVMLAKPRAPVGVALALVFISVTWMKAPRLGNHEVLLALVSASLLLSAMFFDDRWLDRAAVGLRWLFVIAYGSMAVSKLNDGFLSPDVSCAVVFGDEIGRWVGLEASANPTLALASITVALGVELSIPLLLIFRRWRNLGVLVGLVFHTFLAFDPSSHVLDFTSTLTPLFLLFADQGVRQDLNLVLDRMAEPFRGYGLALAALVGAGAHGVVVSKGWPRSIVAYPVWLVFMAVILRLVIGNVWDRHQTTGELRAARLDRRVAIPLLPVLAIAVVNGAAPYLQLRTAAAFNMYSNLETVVDQPNHLLFSDVDPIRASQLVMLTDAPDDHPLAYYVDRRVAIPVENLRYYRTRTLARHGGDYDADVALQWLSPNADGGPSRLSDLEAAGSGWRETLAYKLGYRRSVVLGSPARCLREWGPIG